MKKIEINEEEFIAICVSADNMADAARKTGLHPNTFRRKAKALGCYKPNQTNRPAYVPHSLTKDDVARLYLSNAKAISTVELRHQLLRHGFKEHKCELCGLSEWLGASIPLELHHRDGNRYNNKLDNLLILCPTCHSWITKGSNHVLEAEAGRLITVVESETKPKAARIPVDKEPSRYVHICPVCNKEYKTDHSAQKHCSYECARKTHRKFEASADELLSMFKEEANYTKIAHKLGVSDNAVKKRCKTLGIYDDVKALVDAEKRERAIKNQGAMTKEHRQLANVRSREAVNRDMDYYVGYTIVDGAEVELVRFENTEQLRKAGYSDAVVQRVCLGRAKTYKGWFWKRVPKEKYVKL